MAITIDWNTRIIYIPRDDLTVVQLAPTEIRAMDLNWFRIQLKSLEDSEVGMVYPDTHRHNTTVTVGGFTLARVIEIINDFTLTFEDGQYAVNLTGANSNVGDRVNVNQVSVRSYNSAGMIVVSSEGGTGSVDESTIHAALNSYVNKNLYKADVSNVATSAQVVALGNSIANLDTDVSALQTDVDSIDTKVTNVGIGVTDILSDTAQIDSKISAVGVDVDTALLNLAAVDTKVTNVGLDVDTVLLDIAGVDTKVFNMSVDVDTIDSRTDTINTAVNTISSAVAGISVPTATANANAVWGHASASQLLLDVSFIKGIEGGKWSIANNQMIFYAADNVTELARFNLFNGNVPAVDNVTRRERV